MASLSYEDFVIGCKEFLKVSKMLGDSWNLINSDQDNSIVYLRKTHCFKKDETEITEVDGIKTQLEDEGADSFAKEPEPPDPSCICLSSSYSDFITYEYHIVYSFSHSVPTLYFNAWYASGKILTLEEVWKLVNLQFSKYIEKNKWNSLTQTEHPVLGRPFFQLHPCHTANLMGDLSFNSNFNPETLKRYIISWLSMFGPVIGLEISLGYFDK